MRQTWQRRAWRSAAAVFLAGAVAACRSAGPAPPEAVEPAPGAAAGAVMPPPRVELAPCGPAQLGPQPAPEMAGAQCGVYEVFENQRTRAGRTIPLQVLVLPATGAERQPDPLLVLLGGPGQAAVAAAPIFAKAFAPLRQQRDLVFIDQRGTGGSRPLHCPLPGSDDDPQAFLGDFLPVEALRACLAALDADPRLYTTPIAVEDLEEVRAALQYSRVNLFGHSYGSRAALVWMRTFPSSVRAAILYGAAPTGMHPPLHHAPDAQRALDRLLAECGADAACGAAYPDLPDKLPEVLARLAAAPAEVEVEDPKTKRPVRLRLSRDLFAEVLRWRLYDERAASVPSFIAAAHAGDFAPVARAALALRRAAATGALLAVGTYLSTTCAEDVPAIAKSEADRLAAGTFLGSYRVDQQRRACEAWPRGEVPRGYAAPVAAAVPALVVSGERDPVTPLRWGEEVVRHLPRGRHLVLAHGAHGLPGPCLAQVFAQFLDRADPQALDIGCVQEIERPPFVLP